MDHRCSFANRIRQGCVVVAIQVLATASTLTRAAPDDSDCRVEVGRVVSRQGTVEVRHGAGAWVAAKRESVLCDGDAVRTGRHARAALFIRPENIVRLDQNTAVNLRVNDAETLVEFFTNEQRVSAGPDCGAAYFVSRFPRRFKVRTHYVNAEIEGTEFLVRAACEATTVAVYEGAVRTTELATERVVTLKALEQLTVGPAYRQSIPVRIQPRDGVQWTIHYPRLTARSAFADDTSATCAADDDRCEIARAESLLAAGRADDAQAALQRLSRARNAEALALESIVRIARNERDDAVRLATDATIAAPDSTRAWTALSFARQAKLDLDGALTAAREAVRLAPQSAVAAARVAELLMAKGDIRAAEREADRAVANDPADARALLTRGFARLGSIHRAGALEDFEAAIEADSTEPLARLGAGLAKIRGGQIAEGREDIAIAVALDPTSSVNRTYLGKAFYEENSSARDRLASEQFRMASELDPGDPTPWHYDALLALTDGRPIEAARSASKAANLNGNRAVLRDEGLIEQDAASRGATLARVYQELGFDALALSAGYQSLLDDPQQVSGHRFLADAYVNMPRHEIARASEVLQAQIRQPLSLQALQPQLSDDRVSSLGGMGPVTSGMAEFNPALIAREGVGAIIGTSAGEHGTYGQQILAGFVNDRFSVSAARIRLGSDGFRPFAGIDNDLQNILAQMAVTPSLSAQIEFRRSNLARGDTLYAFDPKIALPLETRLQSDTGRLGLRYEITPSTDIVASFSYVDSRETVDLRPFDVHIDNTYLTKVSEVQAATRQKWIKLVGGMTYVEEASQGNDGPNSPRAQSGYVYGTWNASLLRSRLDLVVGVSQEHLDAHEEFGNEKHRTNPKLGLVLATPTGLTFRAAYFEVMKRRFFASQTLEPTQVAGFNQFFDDFNATVSKRRGLGIDQRFSDRFIVGLEVSRRDLIVQQGFTVEYFPWLERRATAYAYWTATDRLSVRTGWDYERLSRPPAFTGNEAFVDAATRTIPVSAQFAYGNGLSFTAQATRVTQDGIFMFAPAFDFNAGNTRFWIADLAAQYRLPGRRGLFRLELRNAFDRQFAFQDTDIRLPRFAHERTLIGSLILQF